MIFLYIFIFHVLAWQIRDTQTMRKLHQFILGLVDSIFNTITSQILNMDPFHLLVMHIWYDNQEERHRTMARNRDMCRAKVTFATRTSEKNSLFCIVPELGDRFIYNRSA